MQAAFVAVGGERAQEVNITTGEVPAQTDGDPAGLGPLTVRNAPQAIEIVVG